MSVLLLSGGLDSAVCLAIVPGIESALFVNYGQPHLSKERPRAEALAARFHVVLRQATISVPFWTFDPEDRTMLVPGRNLILASLAAAFGSSVVMGCNADDYEVYPDCRPEFFAALAPLVKVETPLIDKTKAQIGRMAVPLGLGPDETWSCYYPRTDGAACGKCDACKERKWALG